MTNADEIVLVLFFILVALILALVFMYKKLNREAEGKYTIRRMVYKKGGLRDRANVVAATLGTRLGLRQVPHSDDEGEEMDDIENGEGQVEGSGSQGSDMEGEDEQEEEEGDSMDQSGNTKENGSDKSSLVGSESGEKEEQTDEPEVKDEMEAKNEEKQERVEEQGKVEASGGTGLLIDLKQFSGSAIWSEEGGGEGKVGDITAL